MKSLFILPYSLLLWLLSFSFTYAAESAPPTESLDQTINTTFEPIAKKALDIVFWKPFSYDGQGLPLILLWLLIAGVIFTLYFGFINFRSIPLALRTLKGKYSRPDDPGQITHFQALTAALSATVGLGNIGGVAVAISAGGPGAAFWMIMMGLLSMTTKFAECTLGLKYRKVNADGSINGGPMHYIREGFSEIGIAPVGKVLAVLFAVLCVGAALGGGNMYQVNQACEQFVQVMGEGSYIAQNRWIFGLVIAAITGAVIIGGITRIASVTSKLVPAMCAVYMGGALIIICAHITEIPAAISTIVSEAFAPKAYVGGLIGALLLGIKRGTFSNEAGIGSAPTAHAAVKTRHPASEGLVALLEPFIDTVVVCSATALVIVSTGMYGENSQGVAGVALTSQAFASVIEWFPNVLCIAVILFAFSTLISWSYYGQQAWAYLFGQSKGSDLSFKLLFCLFIIIGSAASLGNVMDFSDAMLLGMAFPNLIAVYLLLPKIKEELRRFKKHAASIDEQTK